MHFYTPDIFFFKIDYKKNFILKKKILSWYFFFFNWQKNTSKKFFKIYKIYFFPQLSTNFIFLFSPNFTHTRPKNKYIPKKNYNPRIYIIKNTNPRTLIKKFIFFQKKISNPRTSFIKISNPRILIKKNNNPRSLIKKNQ